MNLKLISKNKFLEEQIGISSEKQHIIHNYLKILYFFKIKIYLNFNFYHKIKVKIFQYLVIN